MNRDILQEIERLIPKMTNAQRKVAQYILNGPMDAAFSTINQIANAVGVSTTSVIRLAGALGYDAFSDFQKALKEYLQAYAAPINKFSLNTKNVGPTTDDRSFISDIYQKEIENLNTATTGLSEQTVDAVARKLTGAKNIYVCGVRTSESIARYLAYNFGRMFMNTVFVDDSPTTMVNCLKHISQEDVLIAVTLSRYNKEVCELAKTCNRQDIPVVAITDSLDSPLIPYSDHHLIGKCSSSAFHNSIVAQIFLCDILIGACSQLDRQRVRENLQKDERIAAQMQHFMRK